MQTQEGHLEHPHVAINSKAIRATSQEAQPAHQLSAYDVKTGVVLFQVNVQEKQNKISALKLLLTSAFIKGRIFTLEAIHPQTELCPKMDRFGGWYLLVAKDNQPTLVADLVAFFYDPPWDWHCDQAETWDKAHGCLEHRRILCSLDLNHWFADRCAGVAQVFRLERTTTFLKSGVHRQQIIYRISNLSVSNTPPLRMLQLN